MLRILIVSLAHLCLIKNSWGFVWCSDGVTETSERKNLNMMEQDCYLVVGVGKKHEVCGLITSITL